MNGQQQPNGRMPDSNGVPKPKSQTGGLRVPSVEEALPFSPFSSIVPFNPDIIPPPLALLTPSPTYFGTSPDVIAAKRTLELLSVGATSAEHASQRCQQTLRDVQKLLDPDSLTQFKYKIRHIPNVQGAKSAVKQRNATSGYELSPFAKMVLETSDVSFRYLTPEESPEPIIKPQANETAKDQKIKTPTPHTRPKSAEQRPNELVTPRQEPPPSGSQVKRAHAVVVPAATPAQRAECQDMSQEDNITVARYTATSKPRDNSLVNGYRTISVDQKHKGEQAVQSLQTLLQDVFEAEDQLQPDTSGAVSTYANSYFALRDTGDGSKAVLLPELQARLDTLVQKAVANGRLESIELDSLIRAQRLCETAVSEVASLSLQVGEEWSEQDAEEWVQRVIAAESGITAARTLLRIMGAGAHVKELQSEDYLRAVLSAVSALLETCIVPVVEERLSTHEKIRGSKEQLPPNPLFATAAAHRGQLQALLHAANKTVKVLGDFIVKCDVDETSLSSVETFCKLLIFAENASTERDSVLGIQTFETSRRSAMDVLAKEFAKYPEQRQYIVDQILTTLDKLPATKQSARQYKLQDAKPIQLVSALLMRLVQTSATHGGQSTRGRTKPTEDEEDDAEDSLEEDDDDDSVIRVSPKKPQQPADLLSVAKPLHDSAQANASYMVKFLLQRAVASSKSSEEPYRKLLDIFTEDFLNVLGSNDWPAAEMLLRNLVIHMINMVDGTSYSVPAKTLALELLGTIGSGVLDLQITARNAVRSLELSESDGSKQLATLVQQLETNEVDNSSLVAFDGPYRMVVEYLQARGLEDAQLRSAVGYHLMQWAFLVCGGREGSVDSDSGTPRPSKDVQSKLRNMISDLQWLNDHYEYPPMSTLQGKLAAKVITLSSQLCKAFSRIFSTLLTAMSSDQPKVKSRALKSVGSLLEKDPSILDRNTHVLTHIFRCANDASPLVRDAAIMLIADCVKLRPALNKAVYEQIIARTRDTSMNVRKRAIKLLKDLYLGTESTETRAAIADAVMARMQDAEESVMELARQTMEDVWFVPFLGLKLEGDGALEAKLRYSTQAALLVRTIEVNEETGPVLQRLITQLISKSKTAGAHTAICRNLISMLSDGIIDNTDIAGAPAQSAILRCLAVFAQACPKLFTSAQVERLEPYTQNLSSTDDLDVYRSAITILHNVMPHQPTLKQDFLQKLQSSLMQSISKLPGVLHEIVPCLWTIDSMLGNRDRLVTLVASALRGVYGMRGTDFAAEQQAGSKATKLMVIVGHFGKTCDFGDNLASFQKSFPWYKGASVAGLAVEVLCPFTSPKQVKTIRQAALEAICMLCQSWPKLLLRQEVVTAFEIVFNDRDAVLEETLLAGLDGFFSAGETSTGASKVPELGSGVASGTERLGKTYVATDQDGASTSIARRFLPQVLRIALSSEDQLAFVASKIIVSVNRQGLVHPKESGPALVALETCPNVAIANMAFNEHKVQHSKHESLFDKEYIRAVQQAFEYQRDVIGNTCGYTGQPPVSKMHLLWEVLKTGKAQVRKKFLSNLAQKLDFTLPKLDASSANPPHLAFVRFCAENLAFFEYDRVDELLHLLTAMEKTFANTGTAVAQAIESEVHQLRVDAPGEDSAMNSTSETLRLEPVETGIEPARLLQLSVAAQICSLIWETRSFIRRLWNMQKHVDKAKGAAAKESNKSATRATNAPALTDAFLKRVADIMNASATSDTQRAVCGSFVDLISVDSEVKVASDEDESVAMEDGYDTPSEGASRKSPSLPRSGGGRGRKRKSVSTNATPRKKGRPSAVKRKSGSVRFDEEDEDGAWD